MNIILLLAGSVYARGARHQIHNTEYECIPMYHIGRGHSNETIWAVSSHSIYYRRGATSCWRKIRGPVTKRF